LKHGLGSKIYVMAVLLFAHIPMFILITFSFNKSRSRSHWTGFTFTWYNKLLHNSEILQAALNTLVVAVVVSVVATVLGTVSAVGMYFLSKRLQNVMTILTNLPIVNPEIVTGVSLMLMFTFLKFNMGFETLILAHVISNVPYVVFSVLPKLKQMDRHLCDVAMDLGCGWLQVFFKVILPEISPGVLSGFLIVVAFSLDDFVISYFTSGPTSQTLPLAIFAMTRKRVSPEINALSTIIFMIALIIIFAMQYREFQGVKAKQSHARKGQGS
jgi:spermidine/putrescine transport system permease protein